MANLDFDFSENDFRPLAARMRPTNLDQYFGQSHLIGEGKPLRKAIQAGHIHSMIFWGPPGTGKTTLAEIIAHQINADVERISAVTGGIKEIRDAIDRAKQNRLAARKTVLFVDEVHRFNKSQQDAFLPHIEDGTIIFIGATTENPSFELNNALLSRARVYVLKSLTISEIESVLRQALQDPVRGLAKERLILEENLLQALAEYANGDARLALNCLELMVDMADETENGKKIDRTLLKTALGERQARFDKQGDRFYDLISALHKSVRGSAPDAALYWYARILTAGGDPLYVARRLLAIASEDIGNADPRAMQVALAAWDCFTRVGAYEGERAIAQAIIYLAVAPKSNAVYTAFNTAKQQAKSLPDYDVPPHLRNAPTNLMKDLGFGEEYRYVHDELNAYAAGENYFPEELKDVQYYFPTNRGMEIQIKEKLERLREQDKSAVKKRYK
ncbi:replication-associated recombination protein A [Rodentibacter pneumotropicus]|uniref:replication-associated recombination protein A n=1 Tax=Rodentibacter pneumotropicus TaxID=758 RepID=UPI00036B7943|nr:replication-associated recombination protein A [Rodentibacter pneumotropicus]NBH75808.1 replication-associated recombination protein A [Rodentibacter pneumotropicus]OOF61070.1 recombination factor protein RarA [Rodentibacter pneumotropicus]THA03485.1 replication-associated recombination protein A [Rodentibacter pneumotropicus]THA06409.1 replication-associated recombination protein A [Rodentibacter pneumotropicus]THA10772.1 replication-associated recombination protein A [Rodentibacter pneumo